MGKYFRFPLALGTHFGRQINGAFSFAALTSQLNENEHVVVRYHNGTHHLAPLLRNEAEFLAHDREGHSMEFFAVFTIDVEEMCYDKKN
jgi:hypothetical protein